MPRPRAVTRTIEVTDCTVLCLLVSDQKTYERDFTIAGRFSTDAKLLKRIQDLYQNDWHKMLHVLSKHETSYHYSMPEQEYIDRAQKLI